MILVMLFANQLGESPAVEGSVGPLNDLQIVSKSGTPADVSKIEAALSAEDRKLNMLGVTLSFWCPFQRNWVVPFNSEVVHVERVVCRHHVRDDILLQARLVTLPSSIVHFWTPTLGHFFDRF